MCWCRTQLPEAQVGWWQEPQFHPVYGRIRQHVDKGVSAEQLENKSFFLTVIFVYVTQLSEVHVQWNLYSSFLLGVWKRNNGSRKTIDAGAIVEIGFAQGPYKLDGSGKTNYPGMIDRVFIVCVCKAQSIIYISTCKFVITVSVIWSEPEKCFYIRQDIWFMYALWISFNEN
jgi:hypothetical protein